MNRQICTNRWFIWAIVFILVVGVGLWAYIEYSIALDASSHDNDIYVITITLAKKRASLSVENVDNPASCPMLSQPAPGWCDGGTVVSGEKDTNGCPTPPKCVRE
jgi:hypothetical protein